MINDIFRVAINFTLQGVNGVLTGHYRQATDNLSSDTDMSQLGAGMLTKITDKLLPALCEDTAFQGVEIRTFIPPPTPPTGIDYSFGDEVFGAVATPALPPLVCVVLRRKTSLLGRRYRGRQYVSGLAVADALDGKVTDTWFTANNGLLQSFVVDPVIGPAEGGPTFAPCVAAFDASVTSPIPGIRVTDISSCVVDHVLRNQRRRQIGVGS